MAEAYVRPFGRALLLLALVGIGLPRALAAGEPSEGTAIGEIVDILVGKGLIDETQADQILMKHGAESVRGAPDVAAGPLEGLEWSSDFRLRYEAFRYDRDSRKVADPDNPADSRDRFRYRVRIGVQKQVNDWARVALKLASGSRVTGDEFGDPRSTNRTLGDDDDFDPDEIFIDQAYAVFTLPEALGIKSDLVGGKMPNPFYWKVGRDGLVWDNDVNPEGAAWTATLPLGESAKLFANAGAFIDDENTSTKDPKVFAFQLGSTAKLAEKLEGGIRTSWYEWRALDDDFIDRAMSFGNLANGFDHRARIVDLATYLTCGSSEDWPVTFYATAIENVGADDAIIGGVSVDEENQAYGAGLEVGSSKKLVKLGAGYFFVEANAVIAQFTESDLFDGFTNRHGWAFYAARELAKGVEVQVTLFDGDSIRNTLGAAGPFAESIENADRKRFQTDVNLKF